MRKSSEEGGGDDVPPTRPLSSSPRVLAEVAFLDADRAATAPAPAAALDEHMRLTVLVVAAEADFRRYVRECLRERTDLRLLEAATVAAAMALAGYYSPELLVVDEPQRDVLVPLSQLRAIMIVDDAPREAPASGTQVRLLARPFTAERLMAEVGRLLA
jgi:hypothetical protein